MNTLVTGTLGALACLTLTISTTAQARIALCGAAGATGACQWSTVQSTLQGTGAFSAVDIIDVTTAGGGTPTLATLLQYDALLCWTNTTPANNATWGDVLADYVDAGGGVVVAVFANSTLTVGRNIAGRWQNGYEVVLDQGGTTGGGSPTLGNVLVPTHPAMNGVTAFQGGTTSSRPTGTALEVGAFVVAEWSDTKILVAQGANTNRIDLGFYPPLASCTQSGWVSGGDLLMQNALLAVANGATFGPYGSGCTGTVGVPQLAAQAGSRPIAGQTFAADLSNLPFGIGLVGLGLSNTQSGALPLPFDLTPIGMTGCSLLADPAVFQVVTGVGTTAPWTFAVPPAPTFLGVVLYAQGFSLDPTTNAFGFTASNAGRLKIGL
jgi:hypothetical protein